MTRSELNKLQIVQNTKKVELAHGMRKRDGITIERTADALDEVRLAAERELNTRGLERESRLSREVRAALERFASGNYGTCLECEEAISTKRLNAMPWATLCIECQQTADHRDMFLLKVA